MCTDTVLHSLCSEHRASAAVCAQTARFLVKSLLAAEGGKAPAGSVEYVADARAALHERCAVRTAAGWLAPDAQVAALRCVPPRGLGLPRRTLRLRPAPSVPAAPGVKRRTRSLPARGRQVLVRVGRRPVTRSCGICCRWEGMWRAQGCCVLGDAALLGVVRRPCCAVLWRRAGGRWCAGLQLRCWLRGLLLRLTTSIHLCT